MGKMAYNTELSQRRIMKIQHLLRMGKMTVREIAESIFLSKRWTQGYINHLHSEKKLHICEYRNVLRCNGAGLFIAVYCWGDGKDAKKPAPMTKAEIKKKYRSDPAKIELIRERDRLKKKASRLKPKRDWAAAWIPIKEAA